MKSGSLREPLGRRLRALHPGASGRRIKRWLEAGRVRVNGTVIRRGDVPVGPRDRVVLGAPEVPFPAALRLVHEDARILVVDKPPGLLTIAAPRERGRTAYRLLRDWAEARSGGSRGQGLFVVHRLDRETSGLLVFARTGAAKRALQAQFRARRPERVYVACVEGALQPPEGTLASRLAEDRGLRVRPAAGPERGVQAITRYRVLERYPGATLVELRLVTGRRGQIRAQLAAAGHPIAGDRAYGSRLNPAGRLCLHATRLGFVHPDGHPVVFTSPAPDFRPRRHRAGRGGAPGPRPPR
jgi:23S rRNA pseudouridine1911/1915/1917 synthase